MNIRKILACSTIAFSITLACGLNVLANDSEVTAETNITAEGETKEKAGYINASKVRLRSESSTDSKIIATMNRGARLTVLSKEGEWYKVIHNDSNGYVFHEFVTLGETAPVESSSSVECLDWWDGGKSLMKIGTIVTVTDVSTGVLYKIRVMSSGSHADVEPLTADDTAKMKQTRGGQWSWSPRAILLTFENGRTIAASANGMPHSVSTIKDNNFPGHFCIHFLNSRNHYNNKVDAGHQAQVKRAFDAS